MRLRPLNASKQTVAVGNEIVTRIAEFLGIGVIRKSGKGKLKVQVKSLYVEGVTKVDF